jgi:hypothetical protein
MQADILLYDIERRLAEQRWSGLTRDEAKRLAEHVKRLELILADMLRLVREKTKAG